MHSIEALNQHIEKDGFRLRGVDFSRIDAFSDVVFGFALTLLVVSLEVPHTFKELNDSLRGFIPFAICFFLLILIWYSHYKFFRRYGLHDLGTITINALLLFVVLFYVYPLKFLFTVLTVGWVNQDASAFGSRIDMRNLMLLYGIGFSAVYWLFAALCCNAMRQRAALQLNAVEVFLTRSSILEYGLMGLVGAISCCVATIPRPGCTAIAGLMYIALWPIGQFHGRWERRRLKRMQIAHP
jgi:uncharacterized membrane protein